MSARVSVWWLALIAVAVSAFVAGRLTVRRQPAVDGVVSAGLLGRPWLACRAARLEGRCLRLVVPKPCWAEETIPTDAGDTLVYLDRDNGFLLANEAGMRAAAPATPAAPVFLEEPSPFGSHAIIVIAKREVDGSVRVVECGLAETYRLEQ